jgi:peptidoglycan biosynthesis protein MviN/MurJ (putative lipid II flippase)
MLLNLAMLAGAFVAWKRFGGRPEAGVFVLAGAVVVGGIMQLGVQLPAAWRCGVRLRPGVDFGNEHVRAIGARMLPVLAGTSAYQVCVLVNRLLAKGLCREGAVSYLTNSNILVMAPIGVIAVAMSAAALPVLSSLHARKDREGFNTAFLDASRMGVFLLMPIAAVLMVCGEPIVRLLFERGNWSEEETPRMAMVLFWAAGALVPTVLVMLASRAFYARKRPWLPAKIALVTVAVNLVLSVLLVNSHDVAESVFGWLGGCARGSSWGHLIRWTGVGTPGAPESAAGWVSGAPGLALATCTAIWLQAVLLLGALRRECRGLKLEPLGWSMLRTFGITAVTALVLNWVKNSLPPDGEGVLIVIQRGIAPPVLGAFAYWLVASLADSREYAELWKTIRRRKKKDGEGQEDD